jgi:hypothetical protein
MPYDLQILLANWRAESGDNRICAGLDQGSGARRPDRGFEGKALPSDMDSAALLLCSIPLFAASHRRFCAADDISSGMDFLLTQLGPGDRS